MCSAAVVSNCALLYIMFTNAESTDDSWWNRALICVSLDHILLAVQSLFGVLGKIQSVDFVKFLKY